MFKARCLNRTSGILKWVGTGGHAGRRGQSEQRQEKGWQGYAGGMVNACVCSYTCACVYVHVRKRRGV